MSAKRDGAAPWSESEVEALTARQANASIHEYTCGVGTGGHPPLVPTRDGWVCSVCDYTQDWAHPVDLARTPTKEKAMRTNLAMIVDRSGSMSTVADEAASAINNFIKEQKQVPGKCRFTMVQFDEGIETLYDNIKLSEAPTDYVLKPRGMTPLFDAIGRTVARVDSQVVERAVAGKASFDKVIVVIMTDGFENASREFTRDTINQAVSAHIGRGWDFVYLGAGLDVASRQRQFDQSVRTGVPRGSTVTMDHSAQGYNTAFAVASAGVADARMTGKPVAFTDEQREQLEDDADTSS